MYVIGRRFDARQLWRSHADRRPKPVFSIGRQRYAADLPAGFRISLARMQHAVCVALHAITQ